MGCVGILTLISTFCLVAAVPLKPDTQTQVAMNAGQSIDEHLLTPLKVHNLENGDKEVTFQAVEPLELTTTSTANGMKSTFETTFMVCQQFDLSGMPATHVTKFEPIISKQADAPDDGTIVHHIDIFLCDKEAPHLYSRSGGRCDSFPDEGRRFGKRQHSEMESVSCREFVYAYDRGAGAVTFPADYGVRIGAGTPWKYAVMQRHLLLSKEMKGTFKEFSAVKMTTTTKLRPQNLGMGGILDYALYIPGGKKAFEYTFTCGASQVAKMLTPDSNLNQSFGIRPVVLHLHMHNRGKKMRFEAVRKGKKWTIGEDMHYGGYGPSESYHIVRDLADDELIRKDDELRVTCTFDTKNKKYATSYGIDWHDEMCGPLMYYAPHDPNNRRPNAYACEADFGNDNRK